MATYTKAQLDAFWARYVTMKFVDFVSVIAPQSAAYEPGFAAMLGYVVSNKLYGFDPGNGTQPAGMGFPQHGSDIFNGPTKS